MGLWRTRGDAGLLACLRALPVRLIEAAPREPAWRRELHILHLMPRCKIHTSLATLPVSPTLTRARYTHRYAVRVQNHPRIPNFQR